MNQRPLVDIQIAEIDELGNLTAPSDWQSSCYGDYEPADTTEGAGNSGMKNGNCTMLYNLSSNSLCPSEAKWWGIWVNIGSSKDLLPEGTKPFSERMLIHY